MTPKKDSDKILFRQVDDTNTVQIHVHGDMMPNSKYLFILELLKINKDDKQIVFIVSDPKMMLLVRESFPAEYYERIEIVSPGALNQEGELKNAG